MLRVRCHLPWRDGTDEGGAVVAADVTCPGCGEDQDLAGTREGEQIALRCGRCDTTWTRSLAHRCGSCGGDDLQTVPVAIVEKSRGTQLSVVGIRPVEMCRACDREAIERWQANRPNALLPDELPTVDPDGGSPGRP